MSTIETRLSRVERALSKPCEGHHVAFRLSSRPSSPPPPPCPACGRAVEVVSVLDPFVAQATTGAAP